MHISVCTEWIDVCDTRRWYFWMNTEYLSRCPTIIPIAFWKLWQCYNLTRRLHFGRCAKHSNKSRWCPGPESNSLHPHHGRHLRFGVPTSSHLVFVDVCCLFVKLCLSCFKESRILSTLWNGKHWIQRGQRFDLWTKKFSHFGEASFFEGKDGISTSPRRESRNTFPCDAMVAAGRRFADIPEDMKEKAPFVEQSELNLNISVQQDCVVFFSYKLTPSHLVLLARWPKIEPISWRPLQMLMMSLQRQGMQKALWFNATRCDLELEVGWMTNYRCTWRATRFQRMLSMSGGLSSTGRAGKKTKWNLKDMHHMKQADFNPT